MHFLYLININNYFKNYPTTQCVKKLGIYRPLELTPVEYLLSCMLNLKGRSGECKRHTDRKGNELNPQFKLTHLLAISVQTQGGAKCRENMFTGGHHGQKHGCVYSILNITLAVLRKWY